MPPALRTSWSTTTCAYLRKTSLGWPPRCGASPTIPSSVSRGEGALATERRPLPRSLGPMRLSGSLTARRIEDRVVLILAEVRRVDIPQLQHRGYERGAGDVVRDKQDSLVRLGLLLLVVPA